MKRKCVLSRILKSVILCMIMLLQAGLISAQSTSPLCFTARNGSVTVRFDIKNVTHTIQYSTDSSTWNTYASNTNVTINADQSIYFRAASNQTSAMAFGGDSLDVSSCFYFTSTNGGAVEGSGNIMSLYGPGCPNLSLQTSAFSFLFYDCTLLTAAPSLPATTLADNCYSSMFSGCTSLTAAPSLPATTLAWGCYFQMFYGCVSLMAAPSLPATTLAGFCYGGMFSGCTSLTVAPSLPATTLADWCYEAMFHTCTSLTAAPSLPATTLAYQCYYGMFSKCTSLTTIPSLPATTLTSWCYEGMFSYCSSLVVNMVPPGQPWTITATPATQTDLYNMFLGTGGTMNGTPSINTTYYIVPAYSVVANVSDTSMGCVAGAGVYHQGDVATLTAIPTNHYHFVRWSDGNTQNPRNITVIGDTSYVAIFEIDKHVVSSNHNFVQGTGEYDYGTTVTLTAPSKEHRRFVRWADGTTDSVCSFVLEGDTTVIAVYDIDSFNIAATCLHGTVEGGGRYAWSDVVSLSVSTDKGYRFVQWNDGNEYNPRVFVAEEDLTLEAICEEAPVVGVEDVEDNAIRLYWVGNTIYNPFNELIRVYSTSGKLIGESNENIEMEGWSTGVYLIVDESGRSMKVII